MTNHKTKRYTITYLCTFFNCWTTIEKTHTKPTLQQLKNHVEAIKKIDGFSQKEIQFCISYYDEVKNIYIKEYKTIK